MLATAPTASGPIAGDNSLPFTGTAPSATLEAVAAGADVSADVTSPLVPDRQGMPVARNRTVAVSGACNKP